MSVQCYWLTDNAYAVIIDGKTAEKFGEINKAKNSIMFNEVMKQVVSGGINLLWDTYCKKESEVKDGDGRPG